MSYLIDTDIIIYSLKGIEAVNKKFSTYEREPKSLSVITYGELIFGAHKSAKPVKNLAVVHRLKEIFPVIDITTAIMDTFGNLKALLVKEGSVISDMDLLIASTAITHNLTLVTNNSKHFSRIANLDIENWSE
ncbi:MAG: PIN domain-containing protein [Planctomycetota bacterium]|jgi:tRNA(fMet)-specific endonuclease VapC